MWLGGEGVVVQWYSAVRCPRHNAVLSGAAATPRYAPLGAVEMTDVEFENRNSINFKKGRRAEMFESKNNIAYTNRHCGSHKSNH